MGQNIGIDPFFAKVETAPEIALGTLNVQFWEERRFAEAPPGDRFSFSRFRSSHTPDNKEGSHCGALLVVSERNSTATLLPPDLPGPSSQL